jgi:hypothetical protein
MQRGHLSFVLRGLIQVPTRTMRDGDHHRLTGEGT